MKRMKELRLQTRGSASFDGAERTARRAAARHLRRPMLLSWYDAFSGDAGPLETCSDEGRGCPVRYARYRDASCHVVVDGRYEFFYAQTPRATRELDPRQVIEVHRGMDHSAYDNLQGG